MIQRSGETGKRHSSVVLGYRAACKDTAYRSARPQQSTLKIQEKKQLVRGHSRGHPGRAAWLSNPRRSLRISVSPCPLQLSLPAWQSSLTELPNPHGVRVSRNPEPPIAVTGSARITTPDTIPTGAGAGVPPELIPGARLCETLRRATVRSMMKW